MGDNKKSVDLSSFFLFENVADFDPKIDVYDHHHSAVADPDDAESCCSNGETDTHFKDDAKARLRLHSGSFSSTHLNDYYGSSSSSRRDHREENVSNEEDDDVDKSWTRCRTVGEEDWEGLLSDVSSTANSHCSRSGSRSRKCRILGCGSSKRSSKKKMNEQEKNKLFWENCLASSSFSKLCSNFLFH